MRTIQTITVFGATGMLGKPVTTELVRAGYTVRALVRNPQKAALVFPPEVELIQGDLLNLDDISKALQGSDAIYLNLSVEPSSRRNDFQPERDGLLTILAAAQHFPIRRIGYLSSLIMNYQGFNWWVFDMKRKATATIKNTNIPCTIFYPSTFMETIPGKFIQGGIVMLAGTPVYPNYWIAGSDYAKQVALSFKNTTNERRDYIIQGPEALTVDEACMEFVRYYPKKKLKIMKVPLGMLKAIRPFSNTIYYGTQIIEAILYYPETFQAQNTWKDLGKPTVTIKQYAAGLQD